MMTFTQGTAVRLSTEFRDWNGGLKDPTLVKLIIYDKNMVKIEEFTMSEADKSDIGKYFFDYIPTATGRYCYEWYGELDGMPSLDRDKFNVVWSKV